MLNPCPRCGQRTVSTVKREETYTTSEDVVVRYKDEVSQCAGCEHEFYSYQQSLANSRAIAAAVAKTTDRYSPAQIKALRARLGLTQGDFETVLGVGKKTVARWERGTVPPSGAVQSLFKIAEILPVAICRLADSRGIRIPIPPVVATSRTRPTTFVRTLQTAPLMVRSSGSASEPYPISAAGTVKT